MQPYNHVCEDCGYEWEAGHANDREADKALCPRCGSDDTQAHRAG
ncbi:MAG: zinc ribbon domain-containing protein [Rhodocyclaceae bacterium]|nr:MAG: zinc ribbon domain-containing protein [Rhodocyclaceae bacterium]